LYLTGVNWERGITDANNNKWCCGAYAHPATHHRTTYKLTRGVGAP